MSKFQSRKIYALSVLLLFSMLGGPQLAQAWTMPQEGQQSSSSQQGTTATTGTTEAPRALPDAPSAQQEPKPADAKKEKTPLGAAAAEAGVTAGGAASRPAGSAIAPAKQGQRRSFLIKLGLIAAGGAAIGVVYALSRGTGSVPPGGTR